MVKRIYAEKLFSWELLEFDVTRGITLVDGWNVDDETSEGSGKSSIPNVLCWTIYGKIPKDAKIDEVIKIGEKSGFGQVEFDDGTIIRRSRKPNDLVIIKNGVEERGKDAKETQYLIEKYVGLSFDTFCQTVYFAQNYPKKFITANQEEKAKILSEIQNLEIFDKARKKAQDLAKALETELVDCKMALTDLRAKMSIAQSELTNLEELRVRLQEVKDQGIKERNLDLQRRLVNIEALASKIEEQELSKAKIPVEGSKEEELLKAIQTAQLEIAKINEELKNYEAAKKEFEAQKDWGKKLAQRYATLDQQVKQSTAALQKPTELVKSNFRDSKITKLREFIANPTNLCPSCGTELEKPDTSHAEEELAQLLAEHDQEVTNAVAQLQTNIEHYKEEMAQILQSLTELKAKLKDEPTTPDTLLERKAQYQDAVTKMQKSVEAERLVKRQYDNLVYAIDANKAQLERETKELEQRKIELESYTNQPLNFDDSKKGIIQAKLEELNVAISEAQQTVSAKTKEVEHLGILRNGFKELKTHVFNTVLNEINQRVGSYLQMLFNVPITVEYVNENMKIETNITYDGESRSLGLLSGGQFRRVALATDLAIADVVNSRVESKFGLTILDEYMKDLSENSMQKCLELLQQRPEPVVMVEHNTIFKQIVDHTFFVTLENGTSRSEKSGS